MRKVRPQAGKASAPLLTDPNPSRAMLSLHALNDDGLIVVDRVIGRLGMTKEQFGRMIGVSAETLRKSARAESPKTQARVREAVEIIDRVRDWAGGEAQATAWYKSQPIPAFGGRTAESIVKCGEAPALRDYLDHLAMGGFA
jgi:uncharacterized protein (DUF2384 family)